MTEQRLKDAVTAHLLAIAEYGQACRHTYEMDPARKTACDAVTRTKDALILAAESRGRQQAWQPIATAPKDGTRVICWGPKLAVAECEYRTARTSFNDPAGWYRSNQSPQVWPTQWQPLPEPPTEGPTHD